MNDAWPASSAENTNACGNRLGALQKRDPVLVTASSGNVYTSCAMRSWKCDCAQATRSIKQKISKCTSTVQRSQRYLEQLAGPSDAVVEVSAPICDQKVYHILKGLSRSSIRVRTHSSNIPAVRQRINGPNVLVQYNVVSSWQTLCANTRSWTFNLLIWICQEGIDLCRCFLQQALKVASSCREAVIDVVWEGVKRAHGCLFLRRVP